MCVRLLCIKRHCVRLSTLRAVPSRPEMTGKVLCREVELYSAMLSSVALFQTSLLYAALCSVAGAVLGGEVYALAVSGVALWGGRTVSG